MAPNQHIRMIFEGSCNTNTHTHTHKILPFTVLPTKHFIFQNPKTFEQQYAETYSSGQK